MTVDLAGALAAHRAWLASAGRASERLQVVGGDLGGVDLVSADLRGARLEEADLDRTFLDGAVIDHRTDLRGLGGTFVRAGLQLEEDGERRRLVGSELLTVLRERGAREVQVFEPDARVHVTPRWPLPATDPPAASG